MDSRTEHRGACLCGGGWVGEFCEQAACRDNCNDHGECNGVTGVCTCGDGWGGAFGKCCGHNEVVMHAVRPFAPLEVLNTKCCPRADPAPGGGPALPPLPAFVTVGDPGNAPHPDFGHGSVANAYQARTTHNDAPCSTAFASQYSAWRSTVGRCRWCACGARSRSSPARHRYAAAWPLSSSMAAKRA